MNKDIEEIYTVKGVKIDPENKTLSVGYDIDKDGKVDVFVTIFINHPLFWKLAIPAIAIFIALNAAGVI